jgi:predicted metalloprotease
MRWREGRRSENVEDRRGQRLSTGVRVGGLGGLGLLLVVVAAMLLGVDPTEILQNVPTSSLPPSANVGSGPGAGAPTDERADFVSVVLADTEDAWKALFAASGRRYQEPVLVLFTDQVQSACGFASSATGPFYCPADHKLYIDLGFYDELRDRFQAPGDFAQAYVIAHEVGHHVQNLLGISSQVQELQSREDEAEANRLSVRLELQADCLSGVWANHAQRSRAILEPGDIEEALNSASAVGDDRLQRQARGTVAPDTFTHGSSAQRASWFRRGFESGDLAACDTFGSDRL